MKPWVACTISLVLLQGCGHKKQEGCAETSAFYLELGALYERYEAPKAAAESYGKGVDKAEHPAQALRGLMGLGRVREAQGNADGAIAALEAAWAEKQKPAPTSAPPTMMGPIGDDDLVQRLGRLYAAKAKYDEAERVYEKGVAECKSPCLRDSILQLHVELCRTAKTLDQRVATREKALVGKTIDEAGLLFLAVAYGGDPGAPGFAPSVPLDKLVRVYERLRELHPDDPLLRQTLASLYERAQRVDDARALLQSPTAGPPEAERDCPRKMLTVEPPTGATATAAEAVAALLYDGKKQLALAETAKLVKRAGELGFVAYTTAAQLYQAQDKPELAAATLKAATKAASTIEDQRSLQEANARLFMRIGKADALQALYAKWKESDDACLRAESSRREQQMARPQPPPMGQPIGPKSPPQPAGPQPPAMGQPAGPQPPPIGKPVGPKP